MKLYLDVLKWKCGQDSKPNANSLGDGITNLLNEEGFLCCLGQFSRQIDPSAHIYKRLYPRHVEYSKPNILSRVPGEDTKLSQDCFRINDDEETTIKEKIALLRKRLKRNGHQLIVKNLSKLKVKS